MFEKSNYEGERFQVSRDVSDLQQEPLDGSGEQQKQSLATVGSIKILGGL